MREGAQTSTSTPTGAGGRDDPGLATRSSSREPAVARGRAEARKRLRRWLFALLVLALVLGGVAAAAGLLAIRHFEAGLPSITDLRGNYHPPQVTRVLARDGTLLAELFTERRTVVPIASLPPHVKLAVLAAEDAGFYEHEGLNYYGIARALLVNLRARRTRQGGSTITQQVVKNLLLDPERTYERKIREALLARRLEQELKKDEILELYLNHIYFGHGRYGIEEAARDNFGKSAKDVTIAEAALLAGLVAGPEAYSPRKDVTKALARRAFVLSQMHDKGFLTTRSTPRQGTSRCTSRPTWSRARSSPPRRSRSPGGPCTIWRKSALSAEATPSRRRSIRVSSPPRERRCATTSTRTTSDTACIGPLKAPVPAELDRRGRVVRAASRELPLFEGTPSFETHKVLVGAVTSADDAQGTFDVRVGTVLGTVKLADYDRYNPGRLSPSAFAPVGAHVRVSLLAPVPAGATPAQASAGKSDVVTKVPLRLELGPEAALVAVDVRSRQVLALVGSYEAATGGLDRATQSRRQPGSTFKPVVYSYAVHSRRFTPGVTDRRPPRSVRRGLPPLELRRLDGKRALAPSRGDRQLRQRRRGARAGRRRAGQRRRVGARARYSIDLEARPVARARQLRGVADRARAAPTRPLPPAASTRSRRSSRASSAPTARACRSIRTCRRVA